MAVEQLVEVTLNLPAELAAEINEKGLAEIVFRRKDKKFREFIKAKIANSNASSETAQQIMQATAGNAAKLTQAVAALQFVQIGLQAANIAVDIAGFIYIAKQMEGLSRQLESIADEISKVKEIQIAEIREDCEMLRMDFNSFADKIQNGRKINTDVLENYLKRSRSFIGKLVQLMLNDTIDTECILNMIYTIIPAYTSLLCVFLRAYYYEEKSTPQNYETFLEVFSELNSKKFRSAVQEYYLVDKDFSYSDVVSILNVQTTTLFNERLEIDDQLQLIEAFGDDETYRRFEEALEAAAKKEIIDRADEIADKCGQYANECRQILSSAA